jgi:hypothetical protein
MTEKYLYRFVDSYTVYQNEPVLEKFPILKETPCAFWIDRSYNEPKLVYKNSTRGFAKQTIEDAMESYYRRKLRQRLILKSQLSNVEIILGDIKTEEQRSDIVQKNQKGLNNATFFT